MRIHRPQIVESNGHATLSVRVEWAMGNADLWFSVESDESAALAHGSSDGFVIGLLPIAMALGEDVRVDGTVSPVLKFHLDRGIRSLFQTLWPEHRQPHVESEYAPATQTQDAGAATGVSGGVDSCHAIHRYHLSGDVPGNLRLKRLLFFNVGSHGDGDELKARELFDQRHRRLRELASFIGLPLLKVDSNLTAFYRPLGISHNQSVTMRNVSGAMAVQGVVKRYLVASGPSSARSFYGPHRSTEFVEPFLLPLLKTESFEPMSVGGDVTRGEKLEEIADYEFVRKFLNPCVRSVVNCGRCFKCKSTQLPLEIIGKLAEFADLFDQAIWRQERDRYIAHVNMTRNGSPAVKDVVEFARKRGYPLSASLSAYAWHWMRSMKAKARRR